MTKRLSYLLGEGRSPAEVRRLLSLDGNRYRRAVKDAEEAGWLLRADYRCTLGESERRKHEFEIHGSERIRKCLNELAAEKNPQLKFDAVKAVHIFSTPEPRQPTHSKDEWEDRTIEFGERAAKTWLSHILCSKSCGTMFSRQLASLVRGVELAIEFRASDIDHSKGRIEFVPCWGDGVLPQQGAKERWSRWETSASGIAANLNKLVNERLMGLEPKPPLTLQNVPLLRRKGFSKLKFANVLEFHGKISDYITIFGNEKINELIRNRRTITNSPKGLVWNVDCLLAAVGGTDPPGTIWADEFFRLAGLKDTDKAQLLEEVYGDLGGVWLPKSKVHKRVDELRNLWTCLSHGMISECARKGRECGKVGLVAVAVGSERSEAAIAAVTGPCFVNVLMMDDSCAKEVSRQLGVNDDGR